MSELIGLLLLGSTFALVALSVPWFRRHEQSRFLNTWMIAEMFSVFLVALAATGASFVVAVLIESWQSGNALQIALTYGGALVGLPVLAFGSRWLSRLITRRQAVKPVAPSDLAPAG